MNFHSCSTANERGSVLVAALLILAILTIIGIAAINNSTTERQTSSNFMFYEGTFYAAEAGMEHIKESLRNSLRQPARLALVATSGKADWTFVLNGDPDRVPPLPAATGISYAGGIELITDQPLGDFSYTITVWDNNDGDADPAADADGLIFVRAEAVGPRSTRCSIETLLDANAVTDPITGYNAQEGSGSGKTYTSTDADAVDFGAGFGQQVSINS